MENTIISYEFPAKAQESPVDIRTVSHDLASPIIYTKGGVDYLPNEIENQAKVGICTAISHIQAIQKFTGKKYSPEFQYLLQKKFFDLNWDEGSSVFYSLKAGFKYGYLPLELWTYTTEADRQLPYSQYVTKLQAVPDEEINRLISLCERKMTGYAQVDVSNKENIAHAIDSSPVGILCRIECKTSWWSDANGVTWEPNRLNPLNPAFPTVGGHAIIISNYDYTNGNLQFIPNTWSSKWNDKGVGYLNYDDYKITEAWIPYFVANPIVVPLQFTSQLKLGSSGNEVKLLQDVLKKEGCFPQTTHSTGYFGQITKSAVICFQTKYGISPVGEVGPQTRAKLNSLSSQAGEGLINNNMNNTNISISEVGSMLMGAGLTFINTDIKTAGYLLVGGALLKVLVAVLQKYGINAQSSGFNG